MKNKRVLVLAGHLDDTIIAVGGIVRKMVNQGCEVSVVCFGNGDEGFAHIEDRESCVERFKKQTELANNVLGVKNFECFDYGDFDVVKSKETYRLAIKAIRKYKPDIIFTHDYKEYFQHHATAKLATDAWYQAAWDCSADLGPAHKAKSLYHYEVLQLIENPTHIVDVSDTFEDKIRAWDCFECGKEHLGSLAQQIENRARYYGSLIGVKYAEVLKKSSFIATEVKNPAEEL